MNDTLIKLLATQFRNAQATNKITKLPEISSKSRNIEELTPLFDAIQSEGEQHKTPFWASHMTPSVDDASLLGHLLSAQHNGNLLSPQLYPLLTKIEQQTLTWLCKQFTFPYGHFTHGSSYGNLEALWQAREASDLKNTRLRRIVYASQAAHYSIAKACRLLGLDFQTIPTDELECMNIVALTAACSKNTPLAIIATAGTPASGQIDNIQACVALSAEHDAWLHIDAAWGGALAFVPEEKHQLAGMAQADSLCFDPHKTLAQPKATSLLFYRQPLTAQWHEQPDYLSSPPPAQFIGSHGAELCLSLWSYLIIKGTNSIRNDIEQRLEQAQIFAQNLPTIAHNITHSPTGIVCFSLHSEMDLSDLISQGIFSQARVNQQAVYRAVFADASTQADALLSALNAALSR